MLISKADSRCGSAVQLCASEGTLKILGKNGKLFQHGRLFQKMLHPECASTAKLESQALVGRCSEIQLPGEAIKGFVHDDLGLLTLPLPTASLRVPRCEDWTERPGDETGQ